MRSARARAAVAPRRGRWKEEVVVGVVVLRGAPRGPPRCGGGPAEGRGGRRRLRGSREALMETWPSMVCFGGFSGGGAAAGAM